MWSKDMSPKQTIFVVLFCGSIVVLILYLAIFNGIYPENDSIYEVDRIEPNTVHGYPIVQDENIIRYEFRGDIIGTNEADVYLVEAPDPDCTDLSDMRILREAHYQHDFYEEDFFFWSLYSSEVGDGVLMIVTDNTDAGKVPSTNETLDAITRLQWTEYKGIPTITGMILVGLVAVALVILVYRNLLKIRASNHPDINSAKRDGV